MISLVDIPSFTLHKMELTHSEAREALNCICHSIVFLRGLSSIEPMDAVCDHFNVDYAKIKDEVLDRRVYEAIDSFIAATKKEEAECLFTLSFYLPLMKEGWLGKQVIKRPWEHWELPLMIISNPKNKSLRERTLDNLRKQNQAKILKDNLLLILTDINICLEKNYTPAFNKDYGVCYPFEITANRNKEKGLLANLSTATRELVRKGPPRLLPF